MSVCVYCLQIEVSKGVYGSDNDSTLSSSDRINIHCVVKREMVEIEEKKSQQKFSIPFNSSIKVPQHMNNYCMVCLLGVSTIYCVLRFQCLSLPKGILWSC